MGSPRSPTMMLAAVLAAASFGCDVAVDNGVQDDGATAEETCEADRFADVDVPDSVTVRVSLLEGTARVDADTVRVRRGQSVRWVSDRPFVVFFQRDAELGMPTDAKVFAARAGETAEVQAEMSAARMDSAVAEMDSATMQQAAAGSHQVRTAIRPDAACGVYEYALGVYDEATGTVVPLDPPLMVWP